MASNCKKHGKPREVIYEKKMPNGAIFSVIGCRDCAKQAPAAKPFLTKKKTGQSGSVRKI